MISNQETLNLSPYMAIYDIEVCPMREGCYKEGVTIKSDTHVEQEAF